VPFLFALIAQRPENQSEILNIVEEIYSQLEPVPDDEDIVNDEQKMIENEADEWFIESSEKDTIKSSSPFTNVFLAVEKETTTSTKLFNLSENNLLIVIL
jgi:hypothetical protein